MNHIKNYENRKIETKLVNTADRSGKNNTDYSDDDLLETSEEDGSQIYREGGSEEGEEKAAKTKPKFTMQVSGIYPDRS